MSDTMVPQKSPFQFERINVASLAAAVVLAVLSLWVWSNVRGRMVAPLDRVVIERVCLGHAEELDRELIASERVGTSGILNRHDGFCQYGEGPSGEAAITVPLDDIDTGAGYGAFRWIGLIIELGIVSLFLRVAVEPVMQFAHWIQDQLLKGDG